jgi:ABC-type multidrug transport system fused ATPase/permease subunit
VLRGTVAENIRLADPTASVERVRAAAELAGADGFVEALPKGYETVVGDGGRPLSAGQARRLALARVFLRDAPLVVLDEPTAHLDAESADRIGAAIDEQRGSCTMLVISHRSELAARCDRVVRIEDGRAVTSVMEAVA